MHNIQLSLRTHLQESTSGPQLFILYLNDVTSISDILNFTLFSELDFALFSNNTILNIMNILEGKQVYKWRE